MHRSIPAALISLASLLPLAGCGCDCPGGQGTSGQGAAGVYQVDKAHLLELFVGAAEKRSAGKPTPAAEREMIAAALNQTQITLDLREDHLWTIEGFMEGVEINDTGSWRVEDATLVLTYTEERGQPSTRVVRGSCANGVARFQPGSGSPGEFRYVRQ